MLELWKKYSETQGNQRVRKADRGKKASGRKRGREGEKRVWSQKAQEEEEHLVQEEERLWKLRAEKEEFAVRESGRWLMSNSEVKNPKFIKIREMRESKNIDDYFQIF